MNSLNPLACGMVLCRQCKSKPILICRKLIINLNVVHKVKFNNLRLRLNLSIAIPNFYNDLSSYLYIELLS